MSNVNVSLSLRSGARSKRALSLVACAITACAASLSGCAGEPMPPSRSLADPANPGAPEAPFAARDSAIAAAASPPATGDAHEQGGTDAGVVYTCPMHPEVQSATPGHCPKCGMTLVPKKP